PMAVSRHQQKSLAPLVRHEDLRKPHEGAPLQGPAQRVNRAGDRYRNRLFYSVHTMSLADRDGQFRRIWLLSVSLAATLSGCGTPGAPQPPSLNLPDAVTDLAAVRTGNVVTLTWTMPKRNTDKLLLKGSIAVEICRKRGA